MAFENDDAQTYRVVVNHEEQYSIWPSYKPNPLGWADTGKQGNKADCLNWVEVVWVDMRPLSLRLHMAAAIQATGAA